MAAHSGEDYSVEGCVGLTVHLPGFNRCRVTFPELAGRGVTPQRWAHDRSLWSRSELSPAVTRRLAAVSTPTPCSANSDGAVSDMSPVRPWSMVLISVLRLLIRLARFPDHQIRRIGDRVRTLAGPHVCCLRHQSGLVPILEPDPDLLGGCEHQMTKLVQRLDALLTCRPTSHQQNPHLFDWPIPSLGCHRSHTRQRCSSRRNSIRRIRLSFSTTGLTVGTVNLNHHHAVVSEEPGQSDPPTTRCPQHQPE